MPDVNLLKKNAEGKFVVVTKTFNVDCDAVVLSDDAKIGDIYDPATDTFAAPEQPSAPAEELGQGQV